MADLCGAKTRGSGEPCKRAPLKGRTRCKLHGGATPTGTQNALKHGIYSAVIREDEKELAASMQSAVGRLEDEILICRIQLHRALTAQNAADAGDGLDLEEDIKRVGGGENAPGDETRRKRRDYTAIIDRLTGRIESLEKTRAALIASARDGAPGAGGDYESTDTVHRPDEAIPDNPVL